MKKLIIDILLFILMLLEFSHGYMDQIYHEIIGIILIIILIIHLYFNKEYIKNILKGKYNAKRLIMLIINLGFFISFILSLIFGILSSQSLLTFLNIHNISINKLHKVISFISLIFMGLHLGINFNQMFSKLEKRLNKYIIYTIQIILVIYGIYSFIKQDILKHITGTYGFSIADSNILLNLLEYFSIVMMISIITNYIYKMIKK